MERSRITKMAKKRGEDGLPTEAEQSMFKKRVYINEYGKLTGIAKTDVSRTPEAYQAKNVGWCDKYRPTQASLEENLKKAAFEGVPIEEAVEKLRGSVVNLHYLNNLQKRMAKGECDKAIELFVLQHVFGKPNSEGGESQGRTLDVTQLSDQALEKLVAFTHEWTKDSARTAGSTGTA